MITNASLPTDPLLPNLAVVVDPRRAAEVFGELLHKQGLVVEGCIVDRVKYRPRRNCTLSYRLRLRDMHDGRAFERGARHEVDLGADDADRRGDGRRDREPDREPDREQRRDEPSDHGVLRSIAPWPSPKSLGVRPRARS